MIKVKNTIKILLMFVFVLVIASMFNNVQATEIDIEKVNNDISWITTIKASTTEEYNHINEEIFDYGTSITLNLYEGSGYEIENYKYTVDEFIKVQEYLKSNNKKELIQKVKIQIPNDVIEVKNNETNEQYTIIEEKGNKYIEYDIIVSKVFSDVSAIIEFYEQSWINGNSLKYTMSDGTSKTNYIELYFSDTLPLYSKSCEFETYIANENGECMLEKFKIGTEQGEDVFGTALDGRILRRGGFQQEGGHAQTTINYLNEYIYFAIPFNKGNQITVNINGQNTIFEKWNKDDLKICDYGYVYRTKITEELENMIFSKPQTVKLSYTMYNDNFKMQQTFESKIDVAGTARATVILNKGEEVGVEFNGVLPTGVSISSNNIEENESLYLELSTTGINEIKSRYNLNNAIYLAIKEITPVGGEISGPIRLTFNIGEQYNEKFAYVLHKKHNSEFETFKEEVINGKITIVVDELSPFMVAIEEKIDALIIEESNTEKQLDETPKTGTHDNTNIYLIIVLISAIGMIILKNN